MYYTSRQQLTRRLGGLSSAPAERFAVPADLEDLCATVRQLYRDRDLEIDYVVTGVVRPFGEREDLQGCSATCWTMRASGPGAGSGSGSPPEGV